MILSERPTKITNFRDLDIWRLGKDIVKTVYSLTSHYPSHEAFLLTNQIRRSAVSIPSNIAEGFNRFHNKEYRQFLFIALGSCAELETQIEISFDLGYVDKTVYGQLIEQLNYETRMIRNLIKRL